MAGVEDLNELTPEEQGLLDSDAADTTPVPEKPAARKPAAPAKPAATKPAAPAPKKPTTLGENVGAEDDSADPAEAGEQRTVPHQALHEERRKRQELDTENKRLRTQMQTLTARTNAVLERLTQQPAATKPGEAAKPEEPPPFDKDPGAHIAWLLREQGKKIEALTTRAQQGEEGARVQSTAQGIIRRAAAFEREFTEKVAPDYVEASNFLQTARHEQLADLGYDDPEERTAILAQEAFAIAQRAVQLGKNPAEMIYGMAKRFGYKAKPSPAADAEDAEAAPALTDTERLAQVRRGQRAGASLSSARGGAKTPLTAESLLAMSEKEFDAAMRTAEGRALMGQ